MTHKANPVTLTLIICGEAATTTLGAKGPVKLKNPPAVRPVHLKNPHAAGVSHEPSHRRCVQWPTT